MVIVRPLSSYNQYHHYYFHYHRHCHRHYHPSCYYNLTDLISFNTIIFSSNQSNIIIINCYSHHYHDVDDFLQIINVVFCHFVTFALSALASDRGYPSGKASPVQKNKHVLKINLPLKNQSKDLYYFFDIIVVLI